MKRPPIRLHLLTVTALIVVTAIFSKLNLTHYSRLPGFEGGLGFPVDYYFWHCGGSHYIWWGIALDFVTAVLALIVVAVIFEKLLIPLLRK